MLFISRSRKIKLTFWPGVGSIWIEPMWWSVVQHMSRLFSRVTPLLATPSTASSNTGLLLCSHHLLPCWFGCCYGGFGKCEGLVLLRPTKVDGGGLWWWCVLHAMDLVSVTIWVPKVPWWLLPLLWQLLVLPWERGHHLLY